MIKADCSYNLVNVEKGGFPWFTDRESVGSERGIQVEDSCDRRSFRLGCESRLVSLVFAKSSITGLLEGWPPERRKTMLKET
jgi:hypothetical protein